MSAPDAPVIEIDTATLAKPVGRPAHVRIGGEVFIARCPKDAVLARMADTATNRRMDLVAGYTAAIFGSEAGERIGEMLVDPDVEDVTLATLMELVRYLLSDENGPQWSKALEESFKALGSGPKPRTVRTAPTKKAPAKRAATKRAPARRR
ncbi:hypothetical protein [Streptomyces sp. NBRC 109706]|uniref:hypothetical protein n=1 Tax=Streptomyces sp. NBRC 109706 TaxID=1550035 RepID=UPI00078263F1|nr:hypothetical protein [Streptomyces sp. NBRC 109706]